jgi:hypothetical protein
MRRVQCFCEKELRRIPSAPAQHDAGSAPAKGVRALGVLPRLILTWSPQTLPKRLRTRTQNHYARPAKPMSQQELLRKVVETLESVGIEYMITGSVVSSLQGEPRASHDIDVVVAIPGSGVSRLLASFPPPDYYLDGDSLREAIRTGAMVNLIDVKGGDKVDFWPLTDEPFDQSRFARRYPEDFAGIRMMVTRPEDTILMKLSWAKRSGGSEKQYTDALRVYEVQFLNLDQSYLDLWAKRLSVDSDLARLQKEAQVIG